MSMASAGEADGFFDGSGGGGFTKRLCCSRGDRSFEAAPAGVTISLSTAPGYMVIDVRESTGRAGWGCRFLWYFLLGSFQLEKTGSESDVEELWSGEFGVMLLSSIHAASVYLHSFGIG